MSERCIDAMECRPEDLRCAMSIHTRKITDSCRDKDCIEDLRVYLTFYYKIIADAATGPCRPAAVCGLALFSKRAVLCGENSDAHIFRSDRPGNVGGSLPTAVVEVIVTNSRCKNWLVSLILTDNPPAFRYGKRGDSSSADHMRLRSVTARLVQRNLQSCGKSGEGDDKHHNYAIIILTIWWDAT